MNRERILFGVIILLAVGLAIAIPPLEDRVVGPGDAAPAFTLKTDSGKTITPKEFGGKVLVLNFWATWCRGCLEEFAGLNQFAAETSKEGVVVVGVSIDRSDKVYRRFLASTRPAFETSRDPEADIASNYGTFLFPETYVINREGKVIKKIIGAITDWNDLRTTVKSL